MSKYYKFSDKHPDHFRDRRHKGDKRVFGLIILLAGVGLILRKLNLFHIEWHSIWPIFLIAIGLFIGIQKRFRNNAWWILIFIGTVHLIPSFIIPGTDVRSSSLAGPVALIVLGLFIMFRGKGRGGDCRKEMQVVTSTESMLNLDVTFGGRKEIITSKDFRGGNVHVMFGGCELNLINADGSVQPMVLDLKVSFGGLELIVPAHWEVQNEMGATTFGSIEDSRPLHTGSGATEEKKILVLRGTCTCGGIEIKSY